MHLEFVDNLEVHWSQSILVVPIVELVSTLRARHLVFVATTCPTVEGPFPQDLGVSAVHRQVGFHWQ